MAGPDWRVVTAVASGGKPGMASGKQQSIASAAVSPVSSYLTVSHSQLRSELGVAWAIDTADKQLWQLIMSTDNAEIVYMRRDRDLELVW